MTLIVCEPYWLTHGFASVAVLTKYTKYSLYQGFVHQGILQVGLTGAQQNY